MSPQERWVFVLFVTKLFHLIICQSCRESTPTQLCCVFPFPLLNSPDSTSSLSSIESQSRLVSALYWLCGMERQKEGDNNAVTPPAPEETITSLIEKSRLRMIVNVNLIICLSVTAFIIGYWA